MFFKLKYFLLFTLILLLLKECTTLRSLSIHVPGVVKSGEDATLSCDYDLEQAALYTIKWYRNDIEFYRFVPKESPPSKAFTVPYIYVDLSRSGPKEVVLRIVRREVTGDYKCEVSADAPLFHTEIKSSHLKVAELPTENPRITLGNPKIEVGKQFRAECGSDGSDPAANLTWFINNEKVTAANNYTHVSERIIHYDSALGLYSSQIHIGIIVNRNLFIGGYMELRCEATIFSLWRGVAFSSLQDETPQLAPVLGSTSSQGHNEDSFSLFTGSSAATISAPINLLIALRLWR